MQNIEEWASTAPMVKASLGAGAAAVLGGLLGALELRESVALACLAGAIVSVVIKDEKSLRQSVGTLLIGIFAGWYGSDLAGNLWHLPEPPVAAFAAFFARQLSVLATGVIADPTRFFSWISGFRSGGVK